MKNSMYNAEYFEREDDQFIMPLAERDRAVLANRRRLFVIGGCGAVVLLNVLLFLV